MKYFLCVLIALLVNDLKCFGLSFPDHYERCQVSEDLDGKPNQCLKTSIGKALKTLANGDKDLNLPSFDPLKVDHMTFGRGGPQSPVNLEIKLNNVDLVGISNFVVKKVGGKLSSPKNWNMTLNGKLNQLQILGDYKMNGKVLILPIVGNGKCNITISKLDIYIEIYGQSEIKNGQEYLKITHHKFKQESKRVYIYFGNLFNGDPVLGESTNKFFNDNWTLIYAELRSAVEKGIAKEIQDYAYNFMSKVPFKDIFIVES